MTRQKKIAVSVCVPWVFAVAGLIPLPFPTRDSDRQYAVAHAIKALLENRYVWMSSEDDGLGRRKLYGPTEVEDNGRVYFRNGLGIDDVVFLEAGLRPMPADRKLDLNDWHAIVAFSHQDWEGRPVPRPAIRSDRPIAADAFAVRDQVECLT